MKKSLRWGAATAIAAMSTMTLASCGFGGGSDDVSGSATTLSLMVASYSDNTKAEWQEVIKDFEAANPGINVDLDVESWNDINNVIKTRVQAKKQPDILNIDAFAGFAADDLLYPADKVVSPEVLNDFQKSFADNASIDGVQYGLPFIASARALFYNKDMLNEAGVAAPPKTWAELEAAAKKVTDTGGIGYGMPLGSEEAQAELAIWLYGGGGGYGDASKLTIDSPENIAAVEQMQKMTKEGLTEANAGSTDRTPLTNVFIQGKIAMIEAQTPIVTQIEDKNPGLNYGIAASPTKDGSPSTLGVADQLMAFKNKVDKTSSIKKFLDYFYSAPVYSKWVGAESSLPTTKSGAEAMASNTTIKPFLDLLPSAVFYPSTNPNWSAAQGAIQSQIGRIAQGASPSEVLKGIQTKVDQ